MQMEELARKREIAEAEWPARFREKTVEDIAYLNRAIDQVVAQVNRILDERAFTHNALATKVAGLEATLKAERAAREKLEAEPRQIINVNVPERETTVNVSNDVPVPSVNFPARTLETKIHRDAEKRIVGTTQTVAGA